MTPIPASRCFNSKDKDSSSKDRDIYNRRNILREELKTKVQMYCHHFISSGLDDEAAEE